MIDPISNAEPPITPATKTSRVRALLQRVQDDSLLRNGLYMIGNTGFTSGLGYIYWVVAARTRPEYEVGLASALLSALSLTSTLSNVGLGAYLIQNLGKRQPGKDWSLTLNTALVSVSVLSLIGALLTILVFALTHSYQEMLSSLPYIVLFVLGIILSNVALMQDSAFIAERASEQMLIHNGIFAVGKLLLLLTLALLPQSNLGIFATWVFGYVLIVMAGQWQLRRLRPDYQPVWAGMFGQFRSSLTELVGNHFITAGGILPAVLLPVMVGAIRSPVENAYFYMVWVLRTVYSAISVAIASSLFAEGSYQADELPKKTRRAVLITALLLSPVMLVFLVGSRFILSIFGPDYALYGTGLSIILVVSALPDAITNIYVSVLRVQGRRRGAGALNLAMGLLAVGLALVMIPTLGINGAGIAWLLAESAGSIVVVADIILHRKPINTPITPIPNPEG